MADRISQNNPFGNRPNSRSRIGPSYFNWCPTGNGGNVNTCNNGQKSDKNSLKRRGVGLSGITLKPMVYETTLTQFAPYTYNNSCYTILNDQPNPETIIRFR